MKYLNTYKIFESVVMEYDGVREEVLDIMRDCEDIGLRVSTQKTHNIPTSPFIVWISGFKGNGKKDNFSVTFNEIRPSVEHLINYMKSIGYDDFMYMDGMSKFNYSYPEVPNTYIIKNRNNILPPNDKSRDAYIGQVQIIFKNLK